MQYRADSLGLSGGVTQVFRDLIHQRLGLFYDTDQFDLVADRLAPLIVARGMGSFMDYYYFLKYAEEPDEWSRVMDALAVHETYFWREVDQLRALVNCVVPQLAENRTTPLRIWSVPCASGEEPLTLAMLLDQAGWFDRLPIEIVGSDASPLAIARARQGVYGQRSFRSLPPAMLHKYFERRDNGWSVAPDLRQHVSYDIANLVAEDDVRRHASASIVVCRNVFIYFSDESIQRTLGVLERSLPVPAYLCVGAAESLLRRTASFELRDIDGAFIYVKDAASGSRPRAPFTGVERFS